MTRIFSSGKSNRAANPERTRKTFCVLVHNVNRCAVPGSDNRVGLERAVLHLLGAEPVVEDLIGIGKALIDVALGVNCLMRDVGCRNWLPTAGQHIVKPISRQILVDQRRVFLERIIRRQSRGQFVINAINQA